MHDTTAPKPEALSRTFRVKVAHDMDGAVISTHAHTITLSRESVGSELAAVIDGQPASLSRAVQLIQWAYEKEVVAEQLAPAPIGKARAHKLHKLMARAGFQEHYGFATRALGKQVFSLAALTEEEARKVWAFVCHMCPQVA